MFGLNELLEPVLHPNSLPGMMLFDSVNGLLNIRGILWLNVDREVADVDAGPMELLDFSWRENSVIDPKWRRCLAKLGNEFVVAFSSKREVDHGL
jgi:hypothetical protein